MIYPQARWTWTQSLEDVLLSLQHFDRYDFENFRHQIRRTIKKDLLMNFDNDAHYVRIKLREIHKLQRDLFKCHHDDAFDSVFKFGAELRKNLYYLEAYVNKSTKIN